MRARAARATGRRPAATRARCRVPRAPRRSPPRPARPRSRREPSSTRLPRGPRAPWSAGRRATRSNPTRGPGSGNDLATTRTPRAPTIRRVRAPVAILAALALLAVGVVVVDPLGEAVGYALRGDIDGLRTELRGLGVAGAAILAALILVHSVVLFPAEIANTAAGLMYGFAVALPLVMAAWTVSLLLAYALGAVAGRPMALRLAGERRVELAERVVARGGVPALLLARLVPFVPMSLVGYVAG